MTSTKQKRLAKARRVKSSIGRDLRLLKQGSLTLNGVLEDSERRSLGRARIFDVLRHAPHISDAGAKKILLTARVWPLTKLADLEEVEIEEILECLPPRAR
jgi:hypothetical protein